MQDDFFSVGQHHLTEDTIAFYDWNTCSNKPVSTKACCVLSFQMKTMTIFHHHYHKLLCYRTGIGPISSRTCRVTRSSVQWSGTQAGRTIMLIRLRMIGVCWLRRLMRMCVTGATLMQLSSWSWKNCRQDSTRWCTHHLINSFKRLHPVHLRKISLHIKFSWRTTIVYGG